MRGLSKTFHASINMFISYYLIAAPVSCVFVLKMKIGLPGIYYGLLSGQIVMIVLNQILLSLVYDWNKLSNDIITRG